MGIPSALKQKQRRLPRFDSLPRLACASTRFWERLRKIGKKDSSDIAQVDGLPQRREWVVQRHELVGHVTAEIRSGNTAHHAIPLHFLRRVEFVASRDAAGMKVRDPVNIFLNRAY